MNPTPKLAYTDLHTVRKPRFFDYRTKCGVSDKDWQMRKEQVVFELSPVKYRNCKYVRGTVCCILHTAYRYCILHCMQYAVCKCLLRADCILHTVTAYCTVCNMQSVSVCYVHTAYCIQVPHTALYAVCKCLLRADCILHTALYAVCSLLRADCIQVLNCMEYAVCSL